MADVILRLLDWPAPGATFDLRLRDDVAPQADRDALLRVMAGALRAAGYSVVLSAERTVTEPFDELDRSSR